MASPVVASVGAVTDSPQVDVPAGVAAGDLILVIIGREWDTTVFPGPSTITVDGFTYATSARVDDEGWTSATFIFYKYATGHDTGVYQVHPDDGTGGHIIAGMSVRITGGPTTGNPFVDTFHSASALSGATATIASFTPGAAESLLLVAGWTDDAPYTVYPGAPWTTHANSDLPSGNLLLASLQQTTAAPTGSLNYAASDDCVLIAATVRQTTTPPEIPHGAAAGSLTFTGSSAGSTSEHGAASGSLTFTGSTSGHHVSAGAGSGMIDYAGSAAGHAPSIEQPHGDADGGYTYDGTATGHTDPHGAASGTVSYAGTASGALDPHGDASGTLTYAGTASGRSDARGDADGTVTYTGAASGHAPTAEVPHGDAAGTYAYVGTATGSTTRHGAAEGAYAYVGSAHGTSTSHRDITLTASPLPTRWATTHLADRWSTAPLPERWRVECLTP